jgi:subtilisin family serine protease
VDFKSNFRIFIAFLFMFATLQAANKQNMLNNRALSNQTYVPGQFVVKFKGVGQNRSVNSAAVSSVISQYSVERFEHPIEKAKNQSIAQQLNLQNVYIMYTDQYADIPGIVKELSKNPQVEYAEPNYIFKVEATIPNDSLYNWQYYLPQIYAPEAWDIQHGDTNVVIGIIDTGVDWHHPDLRDVIWKNELETPDDGIDNDGNGYIDDVIGWDFVTGIIDTFAGEDGETPDNDPSDFDGHGTHVSGIAAAHTNNTTGVAAVSWGARIMPLRCGWRATDGNGYVSSLFAGDAYRYAADMGAQITNQSSGNSGQYIVDWAYYAFLSGVLIVESAGNDDAVTPSALGEQKFVMCVASVNDMDQKASYSSFGRYVDISSPGGDSWSGTGKTIISTFPNNHYTFFEGTSMAAPLVASVAALVKQYYPDIGVVDLYSRLQQTADNIDNLNPDYIGLLGAGRVNAFQALLQSNINVEPDFTFVGSQIEDQAGNNNGFLNPGETATFVVRLRNTWKEATNVNATLFGENTTPVTIIDGNAVLGDVAGILEMENSEATASFTVSCEASASPTIVDLRLRVIADGGYEDTLDVSVVVSPQILLVDDDDGLNNVEGYYITALDELGISYQLWDHSSFGTPYASLQNYPVVIWLCEWAFPSLNEADRTWISEYLDQGGRLFLSGQDIGWDLADPTGAEVPNEYGRSGGASKTFYNSYIRADYVADNSVYNSVSGVDGDPISQNITFNIEQPGRARDEQFPDEISPVNNSISIFDFPNGNSGAIRYEGDYRLVYFSFGGYEAITDSSARKILMPRIINWLNGLSLEFMPLSDTEDVNSNIPVDVTVNSSVDNIEGVDLYWTLNGNLPYTIINMTETTPTLFSAQIPATLSEADVEYFFLAKTVSGAYFPIKKYTFHVGPDVIPPSITLVSGEQKNTIDLKYPFEFTIEANDNLSIDTNSAKIHFWKEGDSESVIDLTYDGNNLFSGGFQLDPNAERVGLIYYYFSINDASSNLNTTLTDTMFFSDTTEYVDGFEETLDNWDLGTAWDISSSRKNSGLRSISDSKIGNYPNNYTDSLTYKLTFDLSNITSAWIDYYIRYDLETDKDYLHVQASGDSGTTWEILRSYTGRIGYFSHDTVYINQFAGIEGNDVTFRFVIQTDETGQKDGVFIDDISVTVSNKVFTVIETPLSENLPISFYLDQNYPNPFNPGTHIRYGLTGSSQVELVVYNLLGQKIKTLVNTEQPAGAHRVYWNGTNDFNQPVAAGVYIYQIKTEGFIQAHKMLLLK